MFSDLSKPSSLAKTDNDVALAEQLFRIRYHYAVNSAHGMERMVYKVLPYAAVRSLALTFDPTEPFRLGNLKISPVNRLRKSNVSRAVPRGATLRTRNQGWALSPNASFCRYDSSGSFTSSGSDSVVNYTTQPTYRWQIRDTTRRTRSIGQDMGDLELFKYNLIAPNRYVSRSRYTVNVQTNDVCHLPALGRGSSVESRSTFGGAAYIPDATITTLRDQAITATNQVLTNNLSGLIAATLPNARRYTLARNAFELKDLPRSVASLRALARDLSQAIDQLPKAISRAIYLAQSPKHVPGEYLSLWFGWVSTFKAIKDLLDAPEKIGKEINFLIKRRGIPTTLRRTVKISGGVLTTPGWIYQPTAFSGTGWSETVVGTETLNTFETELRLVINCLFDFPEVGVPELRTKLLVQKWGVNPTASDVYAVIPWTWLISWFTGLSNYVDAIDMINTDKSTINWGVISAVSTGKLRTTHRTFYDNQTDYSFRHNFDPVQNSIAFSRVNTTTESIVDWTVHIRKDIPSGFGVRQTLKPSSLTAWQGSIISALLAQRSGKARYL